MEQNYIGLNSTKTHTTSNPNEALLMESLKEFESRKFKNRGDHLKMVEIKKRLSEISKKKSEIMETYKKRQRLSEYTISPPQSFSYYCDSILSSLTLSRSHQLAQISALQHSILNLHKADHQEPRY